ncbi:MAG: aquaporin [Dehalococcoidia bacterium]|nr:aquaporin [Dehalococcoidia bacterium]
MKKYIYDSESLAEFLGAFTLLFVGAGFVVVSGGTNIVGVALAHGLAIATMVAAFGYISGAVFNPALTIALWSIGKIDGLKAIKYIVSQLSGAIVGFLAVKMLLLREASMANLAVPALNDALSMAEGVFIEAILTFFLMIVILSVIDENGPSQIAGLIIGLVIAMDIFAGGALTGAAMNPARAFGPALLQGNWDNHIVYWTGPILGAVVAALAHKYVFDKK